MFFPLFLTIAGFILGLGALTVIDWHGFLGRHSSYWTEATARTHKITKPLIWSGLILATIGSVWLYTATGDSWTNLHILQAAVWPLMVLNGCFLSFWVSPRLLAREKAGKATELLPATWQRAIFISFLFSFVCWWLEAGSFAYWITVHIL